MTFNVDRAMDVVRIVMQFQFDRLINKTITNLRNNK